ncbi:META domain-containing protein [uncultured Nitratireductor sp.]|uniref:META domain-containing protein n=1 Tax=uncultured Nitratireductor sp. TaxID=520953 RepID=UPI0025E089B4|nr:META domain-containing protein [uncultured Nitratireductor sp.]
MLEISGELTYRARIALPPESLAIVELRNAREPENAKVLAETRIVLDGKQVPIPFALATGKAQLEAGGSYRLRGGVLDGLQIRWLTDPVTIDPEKEKIELGTLILKPYETATPFGMITMDEITGIEWVVEDIDGGGIIDSSRVTLTFDEDGRVGGRASCNSYGARWSEENGKLTISQAVSTEMACAEALMNQEQKFLAIPADLKFFAMTLQGALMLQTVDGRTLKAFSAA